MFMKMASTKRKCKFSNTMKNKFPCFVKGRNENEAKCTICDSYLSVANKGATDLERHVDSERHRNLIKVSASSKKFVFLTSLFLGRFTKSIYLSFLPLLPFTGVEGDTMFLFLLFWQLQIMSFGVRVMSL